MKKLQCLIVDDEPLSRDVLRTFISDHDSLILAGECIDAIDAGALLREREIDLIFLDINMPKISGINFYKGLADKPPVIFTTAYPNYAVEGFEVNAIDYLVKPFGFDRFYAAVDKVMNKVPLHTELNKQNYVAIKVDKKLFKVNYENIKYIESIGDYVKIHTDERTLISSETLRGFENSLPPDQFIRIHKSYIISTNQLDFMEGNQVNLGEVKLPVGKAYRNNLKDYLS